MATLITSARLGSILAVILVTMAPIDAFAGNGPTAAKMTKIEGFLQQGEWKKARRAVHRLELDLIESSAEREVSVIAVGHLAALKAITLAGTGESADATWMWHSAQNLSPRVGNFDLSVFPESVSKTLKGQLLRTLTEALDSSDLGESTSGGETRADLQSQALCAMIQQKRKAPRQDKEAALLMASIVQLGIGGSLNFYAEVLADGSLSRPVVREMLGPPIFSYVVFNTYSRCRYSPGMRDVSDKWTLVSFSLDPRKDI